MTSPKINLARIATPEPAAIAINPDAIGLNLAEDMPFEDWCELGKSLLTNQRRAGYIAGVS